MLLESAERESLGKVLAAKNGCRDITRQTANTRKTGNSADWAYCLKKILQEEIQSQKIKGFSSRINES